jgi:hypothetical protein
MGPLAGVKYPRGIAINHREKAFFVTGGNAIFKISSEGMLNYCSVFLSLKIISLFFRINKILRICEFVRRW